MGEKASEYKEDAKYAGTQTLEQFSRDLTALAEEGKLDPVIGREEEIKRVIQVLSRRTKVIIPVSLVNQGLEKRPSWKDLRQESPMASVPETIRDKRLLHPGSDCHGGRIQISW